MVLEINHDTFERIVTWANDFFRPSSNPKTPLNRLMMVCFLASTDWWWFMTLMILNPCLRCLLDPWVEILQLVMHSARISAGPISWKASRSSLWGKASWMVDNYLYIHFGWLITTSIYIHMYITICAHVRIHIFRYLCMHTCILHNTYIYIYICVGAYM